MNLKQILYQVAQLGVGEEFESYWKLWHNDPYFLQILQEHLNLNTIPKGFNKRIEGYDSFPENTKNMIWTEDNDTYYYGGDLVHLYPELAGLYAKSLTSGNITQVGSIIFKLTIGYRSTVRGIDIDSIIAFDSTGRGCLFIKR